MFCPVDYRGVINISKMDPGRWGSADGTGFKLLPEQVSKQSAYGRPHSSTMHLFIIFTLECEKGTFQAELKEGDNVVYAQGCPTVGPAVA